MRWRPDGVPWSREGRRRLIPASATPREKGGDGASGVFPGRGGRSLAALGGYDGVTRPVLPALGARRGHIPGALSSWRPFTRVGGGTGRLRPSVSRARAKAAAPA